MVRLPEELEYIEAELTLFSPQSGGRTTAIRTGYRPNWWLPGAHDRVYASASLEVVDASELAPDTRGIVCLYPFAPELWQYVRVGSDLGMYEGPVELRQATVTRIVPAAVPANAR